MNDMLRITTPSTGYFSETEEAALISHEMVLAGLSEACSDPDYPQSEMVRAIFLEMLRAALLSADMRYKYLVLLSEWTERHSRLECLVTNLSSEVSSSMVVAGFRVLSESGAVDHLSDSDQVLVLRILEAALAARAADAVTKQALQSCDGSADGP